MRILTTFFCWLIFFKTYAQAPTFTENLSTTASFVCFDGILTFNCKSINAETFQFQKKNNLTNSFEDVAAATGNPSPVTGLISHTFYGVNETITVRVMISNSSGSIFSNEIGLHPQRPTFNFQPIEITQCNGSNAIFRTSASGAGTLIYQWQELIGGNYSNVTNTSDFSNFATPNLTVKSIINTDHGRTFRCFVKDQNQCENYSTPAVLFVNQISSINPTITKKFCEGDTAMIFLTNKVGDVNSYQWQGKFGNATTYSNISESAHFFGVTNDSLKVNGILPSEQSYRLNVVFINKSQNIDGSQALGTCSKTTTSVTYDINPRPVKPIQIDDIYRCGTGNLSTSISGIGTFYWYADTLKAPILSNSSLFATPIISNSTPYYYSVKDANQCQSFKRKFNAIVRELPQQTFDPNFSICPTENTISVSFNNISNTPSTIYVLNHLPSLSGFSEIKSSTFINSFSIPLPTEKLSGNYKFKLFTKNQYCYSDTSIVYLKIKKSTEIITSLASLSVCEGNNFVLTANYLAEPPLKFEWYKDNILIGSQINDSLEIKNSTLENSGDYKVKISGNCGSQTSNLATFKVLPKPQITLQPISNIVCEGGNTTFKIFATGSGTLHYQWFLNENLIGNDANELSLEKVSLLLNNANIKCKVSSDCEPAIFSDIVKLLVDDNPPSPNINTQIGFCKSNVMATLSAEKLWKHELIWFDENKTQLLSNQIDINNVSNRNFYVNQVDSNGCKSPLLPFQVLVSEPFKISVSSDKNALCNSGHFNRIGQISTNVILLDLILDFYTLKSNNLIIQKNTSGDFEVSNGGTYTIVGQKAYCADSVDLNISSIFPELASSPTVSNFEICKNSNATLVANGSFTGGKYVWWETSDLPFQIGEGESFNVNNVQNPVSFYVSYSKSQGDVFCESNRAESKISVKPALKMDISTSSVSCLGISDGSINISPKSGKLPYNYTIDNTITNSSGIFKYLNAGSHSIHISDSDGCIGDSSIIITTTAGPTISTQPVSLSRCKGNTANFSITALNFDAITWEKMLPGETTFSSISGASSSILNLSNIGNTTNPHLTKFRAKVVKGSCVIYSDEAMLFVNSITGTGSSNAACENSSTSFDLGQFTIIGNIQSYQWQYRQGTTGSFNDLTGQTNSSLELGNIQRKDDGFYRCKLVFENGGGNTCIINTSTIGTKLTVDTLQIPILGIGKSICLGQSVSISATNCGGILTWSDGQKGSSINVSPASTTEYTAICEAATCSTVSKNSLKIQVLNTPVETPQIYTSRLIYCFGENISMTATNCIGRIDWSNGKSGHTITFLAKNNLSIYATCNTENCQSPQSNTINIKVLPILSAGQISSDTGVNCSGFNPSTINNVKSPSSGNVQWQKSENCDAGLPSWTNIVGETELTYNPPALSVTTCYRRMVSDSCNIGVFSNIITFEIRPDPSISILANEDSVCFKNTLNLTKTITGGEGICNIQWQINKVSGAVSSSFWRNLSIADTLAFQNTNIGFDSTFYFRAKIDCSNNSCNQATSNSIAAVFHPKLEIIVPFTDSTICLGSQISLLSSGCKGNILWSNGATTPEVSFTPTESKILRVSCKNSCDEVSKNISINVVPGIASPTISVSKLNYCFGETITLNSSNCLGGIQWSNDMKGSEIQIIANSNFSVSANCKYLNCQSPQSNTINIKVSPILSAGQIASFTGVNCSGFNPSTINNVTSPSSGNIQWQKSENCDAGLLAWTNIVGETDLTYNPPALSVTTCYRRMVSDSCNIGVFSNIITFEIRPDPSISILANEDSVCFKNTLNLTKTLTGGEGICNIQWQINKVSGAVSSSFWRNLSIADTLAFQNTNIGFDSTFYFRAKIDCSNNSCNQATSNSIAAVFHPKLEIIVPFTDSTICLGSQISLLSSGCKGNILWSNGATTPEVSFTPTESKILRVSCKNSCDEVSKNISINVVPGIAVPISNTLDSIIAPKTITFSAIGQNLKWYSSSSSTIPLISPPTISNPGIYTLWVSQTLGLCESVKIPITAKILTELRFTNSLDDQTNCNGNTSNFKINVIGSGRLTYQWLRKLPTDLVFSIIPENDNYAENPQTATLKVKSVGNTSNPNLTKYKCVVRDQNSEISSNEATLFVNSVKGSLVNQKLCLGNNLTLDLNNSHLIYGTPTKIQWQQRPGTESPWADIKDNLNVSGTDGLILEIKNLVRENENQYRCALTFLSSAGACTETTDLMTLSVGNIPQTPTLKEYELCQNSTSPKFNLNEPSDIDVIWYTDRNSNLGVSTQPKISTSSSGRNVIFVTYKNKESCESDKVPLFYNVNPIPSKPINLTPANVIEGENLVFLASGENLKWYTSRTGKTFSTTSPLYQKVGSYDHYVSQTNLFGCESDRQLIESEIIAAFAISTQPTNQTNCDGNTVTFSLKTKGATNVKYQWQIKNLADDQFENLLGQTNAELKITDVGTAPFIDNTTYRCLVSNDTKILFSNLAQLKVNKIESGLSKISICENSPISAQIFETKVYGNPNNFEWQKKNGSTYTTLFTTKNFEESIIPNVSNSGDYRLRITFKNQGTSTCIRNSDNFKMEVNEIPEPFKSSAIEFCEFEKFAKILDFTPKNSIIINKDSTSITDSIFIQSKTYLIQNKSDKGCLSTWTELNIKVNPAPNIEIKDSTFTFCKYSEINKPLIINDLNTRWYQNLETNEWTENSINVKSESIGNQIFWASIEGQNGCFSQKKKVIIVTQECIFDEKIDSCIQVSGRSLLPNEWNYFYDKKGRIFAAVHPQGQNLGNVKMDFRSTASKQILDLNQNAFLPRYFAFQATKSYSNPIKLRLFFNETEIENFEKESAILVLNYLSQNIDCETNNNKKEEPYWIIAKENWQNAEIQSFKFVEFSSTKIGEIALWQSKIPSAILSGAFNNKYLPTLKIESENNISVGHFAVQKSEDGKSYFNWLPKVDNYNFLDLKPFQSQNYYSLVYDFENGIKYQMNTISLTPKAENVKCLIFENPTESGMFLKLYFPDIEKSSVILNTASGQQIYIKSVIQKEDYFEIHPNSALSGGFYIISAKNKAGKSCGAKVWVR